MPRASKQQTELNRDTIVSAASHLYREHGIGAVSLSEIMNSVGMTNGAFYSQFASRSELASLACADAFETANAKWRQRIAAVADPAPLLQDYVRGYLSTDERDDVGGGCAAAAMAGEMGKPDAGPDERQAFLNGLLGMIENIEALNSAAFPGAGRNETLSTVATLVGALVLSRATRGDRLSGEFLKAAREHVLHLRTASPDK